MVLRLGGRHVHDDKVRPAAAETDNGCPAVRGDRYLMARKLERLRNDFPHIRVVVNHQNTSHITSRDSGRIDSPLDNNW